MTDEDASDIPPALTSDEWAAQHADRDYVLMTVTDVALMVQDSNLDGDSVAIGKDVNTLAALIALANAALHDEDPRKFRREHVTLLRAMADRIDNESINTVPTPEGRIGVTFDDLKPDFDRVDLLHELADALESYLPPN